MKITKTQLKKIIKEELEQALHEFDVAHAARNVAASSVPGMQHPDRHLSPVDVDDHPVISIAYDRLSTRDWEAHHQAGLGEMDQIYLLWDRYQAKTLTLDKETATFMQQLIAAFEKMKKLRGASVANKDPLLSQSDINHLQRAYEEWAGGDAAETPKGPASLGYDPNERRWGPGRSSKAYD